MFFANRSARNWLTVVPLMLVLFSPFAAMAKSIAELTKDMEKFNGFYSFYYDQSKGKVLVEINQFNQPFIFQSSLPYGVGSNDIGLDRGQLGETRLVQFERYGNKVLLKQLNTYFRSDSDNAAERQSIKEAFASSVIAGFTVAAEGKGKVLIDYTDFLLSDIHGIGRTMAARKQGSFSIDTKRSAVYKARSKAFPKNTELEALITFKGSKPGNYVRQVAPDPYSVTVHMHHSFIELPDDNYKTRTFHPYSGYWSVEVKDYASPIDAPMEKRFIPRHRLAKKNPNAAKSEAVEPIVYYLDPGVPEPVRGALLDGAKWWNEAFEAAGYIDAFQVKILPADADPMDVRYNVIQWVHRATRGWSYGGSVTDPRTGEILKGHVTLGSLRVRQDLLIAQGLTAAYDGSADKQAKAKAMALDRIRQLSAHEVGHTLGIAHNFAASVNDRASVMDYPHPLVTIDNNGDVVLNGAYDKGIGEWDKHVVKYGYGDYGSNEAAKLAEVIAEGKDKGLLYLSDPDSRSYAHAHPKSHLWDNGKDPVDELNRMVKVRAKALSKFGLNSIGEGMALSQLEERLVPIYLFHRYQIEAAGKYIGGLDYSYELKENGQGKGGTIVDARLQKAALAAILATLEADFLELPQSVLTLIVPKAYGEYKTRESFKSRTGITFDPVSVAEVSARHSLNVLLHSDRLHRVQQQSAQVRNGLTLEALLDGVLNQTVKAKKQNGLAAQIQSRVAHLAVEMLVKQFKSDNLAPEVKEVIYGKIISLGSWLKKNKRYALLAKQIQWFENTGKWKSRLKPLDIPPGSPI